LGGETKKEYWLIEMMRRMRDWPSLPHKILSLLWANQVIDEMSRACIKTTSSVSRSMANGRKITTTFRDVFLLPILEEVMTVFDQIMKSPPSNQPIEACQQSEMILSVLEVLLTIFKYDYSALGKYKDWYSYGKHRPYYLIYVYEPY
jgi:hypothetical protein